MNILRGYVIPTYGNTLYHVGIERLTIESGYYPTQELSYNGGFPNFYVRISPTNSVTVIIVRNRSYGGFGACHHNAVRRCVLRHLHTHEATCACERSRLCFVLPNRVARNDDIHDPGIARAARNLHVTAYARFCSGQ